MEKFGEKLKSKYKRESLKVVSYCGAKAPATVECNKCKAQYTLQHGGNFLLKTKQVVCKNCTDTKQRIDTKNKFFTWYHKMGRKDFVLLDKNIMYDKVLLGCIHCGKTGTRSMGDLLKGKKCACQTTNTKLTQQEFEEEVQKLFAKEYTVLSRYDGRFSKVKIRHSCGFIWNTTPKNLVEGKGCPKCNRKQSKGAKTVEEIIKKNNFEYKREFPIKVAGKTLYFDFYIPKINLFIEYNGIQHYEPVEFFGGLPQLELQKYNDSLKRDYCIQNRHNLLVIKYTDDILSTFNDYLCRM